MRRLALILLLSVSLLVGVGFGISSAIADPVPDDQPTEVRVKKIVDGDTIYIGVRYLGIDTPERGQPLYCEAKEANRDLIGEVGEKVRLVRDDAENNVGNCGRLLRYVCNDGFINLELVKQGLALVYSCDDYKADFYYEDLTRAADKAADERLGIWGLSELHPKLRRHLGDNKYYIPHGWSPPEE